MEELDGNNVRMIMKRNNHLQSNTSAESQAMIKKQVGLEHSHWGDIDPLGAVAREHHK